MTLQRGQTGDGYVYYRDRSNGMDVTVYEHQLLALEYHSPHRVFDPETEVDHLAPAPDANVPEWLRVLEADSHKTSIPHRQPLR